MLTRLKVNGFKNLVNVDVRFGAFTCVAGANGVGKSNLFDAIQFLSALADNSFLEAAQHVRDEEGRAVDTQRLFHHAGNSCAGEMEFEAEMIVPSEGRDNLGQLAKATTTFLHYKLVLAYNRGSEAGGRASLELVYESLEYVKKAEAAQHLLFKHSAARWRDSLGMGRRTSPFISTESGKGKQIIKLHQDGGSRGQPRSLLASTLPRTVLSDTNASENPTALLARLEMRSWRLLQLEPTALRKPDEFTSSNRLGMDGAHLAKSLYSRANSGCNGSDNCESSRQVYAQITNRLSQLLDDVWEVRVDKDEKRELLTLEVAGREGTFHPARSLSDGTLRFLVLSVLELEKTTGLVCFEEPENGIHPQRIESMLELLQDIAMDTDEAIGDDNPLRQVIINTHSPTVVSLVPQESLVVADLQEHVDEQSDVRYKYVRFSALPDTWRVTKSAKASTIPLGRLLTYLNPVPDQQNKDLRPLRVKEYVSQQLKLNLAR